MLVYSLSVAELSSQVFVLFIQLIMPGYCVAGTVGHKVLSGAKKIEIDKKIVSILAMTYSVCKE